MVGHPEIILQSYKSSCQGMVNTAVIGEVESWCRTRPVLRPTKHLRACGRGKTGATFSVIDSAD